MGIRVEPSQGWNFPFLKTTQGGLFMNQQSTSKDDPDTKWRENLLKKARRNNKNKNNGSAMALVGDCYYTGCKGFPIDNKKAYYWFKRAHVAGNVWGTVNRGYMLVLGMGVRRKNEPKGMMFICLAAQRGNDTAASLLGQTYADGLYGFPQDHTKSIYWLEKALRSNSDNNDNDDDACCPVKSTMTKESKRTTQQLLEEEILKAIGGTLI